MNLAHLVTFTHVLAAGSITRAAHRLHYSQSTITAHIQALERMFGTKLLERTTNGVRPTAAGERLYWHARCILALVDEAKGITEGAVSSPNDSSPPPRHAIDVSDGGQLPVTLRGGNTTADRDVAEDQAEKRLKSTRRFE